MARSDAPSKHRDTTPERGWDDGWWGPARRCPSPNQGPRPEGEPIELALLHSISLPPGEYGGPHIEQLFTNQLDASAHPYFETIRGLEVSAHFLIRRDGEVVQFVSVNRRAWHAGRSTWRERSGCNDYSVGIELEGLEGQTFEDAQYDRLVPLLQALRVAWPIVAVTGHEHVAPGRKADPGPGFDWPRLRQALGWAPEAVEDGA